MNTNESSLTDPLDRDRNNKWKPQQSIAPLTSEQSEDALKELNNTSFTDKFPRVDRTYADPILPMQYIGLISFVPSKGATPNENGVYGFAKLRGNFATEIEASERAEFLIKNTDSYNTIYHSYVGRPFPITSSSKFSAETSEVDIRKETTKTISENIRQKKRDEEKEIREIKEKEERLLEETRKGELDPYDNYITLKVKKAQITFTYLEHQKKMAELKNIIIKTRESLVEMDEEYPEFQKSYFEKYMKAREDAGIKEDSEKANENFIKYLVEDVDLGF